MNEIKYLYKVINYYMKKYIVLLFVGFILSILYSILTLINPIVTRIIINQFIIEKNLFDFKTVIIFIVLLIAIMFIIGFFSNYIIVRTYSYISNDIKKNVSKTFMMKELKELSRIKSGDFNFIIFRDLDVIQKFLYEIFMQLPIRVLMFFILIVFMFKISYILSITVLILNLSQLLLTRYISKKFYYLSLNQKNISQKSYGYLTEYLSNIFLIKSINFNLNNNKLIEEYDNLRNINVKLGIYNRFIQLLFKVLNNILNLSLFIIGIILIYNNQINLGTLIEFTMLSSMLYPNIDSLIKVIPSFQETKSSIKRLINNDIDLFYRNDEYVNNVTFQDYNIKMKNINININNNKYIKSLDDLEFKDKSLNLIVGENGMGKSTICSIISKLNTNYKGMITIGGYNIKNINQDILRTRINWVVQNSFVLSGSIYENICSFNTKLYTKEYVIRKLKEYDFLKYFEEFPDILDTKIDENGSNISKGEAQKIAIARILVQEPAIIILDEPTAFLDYNTTNHIRNILSIIKNKSNIIMITHNNIFDQIADYRYIIESNIIHKIESK